MSLDPRTPVLVGAAARTQREDDPTVALDALGLMEAAARTAAADAGADALLGRVRWIGTPVGLWSYPDPAAALASRLGCGDAHRVLAEVGVLQHALWVEATRLIAAGSLDVALVVGGEARHRDRRAIEAGVTGDEPVDAGGEPDERWTTDDVGISVLEMDRGLHHAPCAYALLEQAVGRSRGRSPAEHRAAVGSLWERFASVAAGNPLAWDRSAPAADEIVTPGDDNPLVSTPYTRRQCSNWTVDQAAALLLCSVDAARAAGVPEDRWVFPHAFTENLRPEPVSARRDLARLPGAATAGRALFEAASLSADDVAHVDLYSCFPVAVEVYAAEIGLPLDDLDRPLTVTGGMGFGGGPFNNYVLQSTAQLAAVLRSDPGSFGLTSLVSGFLSKQGFDLWSTAPPPSSGVRHVDVSATVEAERSPLPEDGSYRGPVTLVGATVRHQRGEPYEAIAVCETPAGARALATSTEPSVLAAVGAACETDRGDEVAWSITADGELRGG